VLEGFYIRAPDRAKLAGLPVAKFAAPTSMPCYVDPTAPKLEIVTKPKEKPAPKREKKFFISSVPEKRWRQLFNSKPILSASQIAAIVGCSNATVRTIRNRLGFPAYPSGGGYRKKYFREHAEKLAKARKPGESILALGARFGLGRGQIHHIATTNRDLFPMISGNAGKPCR
jgi:hypothetical protein